MPRLSRMAEKTQDSAVSRNLMLLCMGTGILLIASQWRQIAALPGTILSKIQVSNWVKSELVTKPSPKVADVKSVRLVVDLSDRRVYVYENTLVKISYPVAVGQPGWETPIGTFKVSQKYQNPVWQHPITGEKVLPGKKNPLGKWWIGFGSVGDLLIGFHGTNDETLVGQPVSHGCLRMRNSDIGKLYQQTSAGTVVIVRP